MCSCSRAPRYSIDEARVAIGQSRSWAEALRRLGMCHGGGAHAVLRKYAELWSISSEHFDPYATVREGGPARRRPLEEILVENSDFSRGHLKERLYQAGLKQPVCEQCGQGEDWQAREDGDDPGSRQRHLQRQPPGESPHSLPELRCDPRHSLRPREARRPRAPSVPALRSPVHGQGSAASDTARASADIRIVRAARNLERERSTGRRTHNSYARSTRSASQPPDVATECRATRFASGFGPTSASGSWLTRRRERGRRSGRGRLGRSQSNSRWPAIGDLQSQPSRQRLSRGDRSEHGLCRQALECGANEHQREQPSAEHQRARHGQGFRAQRLGNSAGCCAHDGRDADSVAESRQRQRGDRDCRAGAITMSQSGMACRVQARAPSRSGGCDRTSRNARALPTMAPAPHAAIRMPASSGLRS